MIGRLTWLQDHLIIIATVQPDMTEEQPLLRRLDMRNAHHLYHPVRMCPSGIVADPDVGQGPKFRGLHCEGVSTPTGKGTRGSFQGEWLAFPCIATYIRLFAWGLSPAKGSCVAGTVNRQYLTGPDRTGQLKGTHFDLTGRGLHLLNTDHQQCLSSNLQRQMHL